MSSELKTNKISPATGTALQIGDSGDTITIPSGATLTNSGTATGFGKVLQVVSMVKTDTASTTSSTFVTTGIEVSITPSSTSSKVLILANPMISGDTGSCTTGVQLNRDSTVILQGDADGSRTRFSSGNIYADNGAYQSTGLSVMYLDSPSSTSELTYKIMYFSSNGSSSAYVNRPRNDVDNIHYGRTASTITVMEIAG